MNINSGFMRTYRGKIVEYNQAATGPSNYFKDLSNPSEVNVTV